MTQTAVVTASREWHLTRRPDGVPVDEDFALVDVELPAPDGAEILVRNSFLSVDPYMRGRMNDARSYVPAFKLDQPMDGAAVGVVEQAGADAVDSDGTPIAVGDTVVHGLGWRTAALVQARSARVLDTRRAPAQAYLGVLGMPGLTAYAGLLRVGELAEGDRVFVSAAAGAVGSLVGQSAVPEVPTRPPGCSTRPASTPPSTTRRRRSGWVWRRPRPRASTSTSTTLAVTISRPPSVRFAFEAGSPSAG